MSHIPRLPHQSKLPPTIEKEVAETSRGAHCMLGGAQASSRSTDAAAARRSLKAASTSAPGLLAEVFYGVGQPIPAGRQPTFTTVVPAVNFSDVQYGGGIMAVANRTTNFAVRITGAGWRRCPCAYIALSTSAPCNRLMTATTALLVRLHLPSYVNPS